MSTAKKREKNISACLTASIDCLQSLASDADFPQQMWREGGKHKKQFNSLYKNDESVDPFDFDHSENVIPPTKSKKSPSKDLSAPEIRALKKNIMSKKHKSRPSSRKEGQRALQLRQTADTSDKSALLLNIRLYNALPNLDVADISALSYSLLCLLSPPLLPLTNDDFSTVVRTVLLIVSADSESPKVDIGSFDLPHGNTTIDLAVEALSSLLKSSKFSEMSHLDDSALIASAFIDIGAQYLQQCIVGDVNRLNDMKQLSRLVTVLDDILSAGVSCAQFSQKVVSFHSRLSRLLLQVLCSFLEGLGFDSIAKEEYCVCYVGMLKLAVTLSSDVSLMPETLRSELMQIGLSSVFCLPGIFSQYFEMELCVLGLSLLSNLLEDNHARLLTMSYPGASSLDNLRELALLFERHATHAVKIESELNSDSVHDDSVRERRLSRVVSMASTHMDESLISAYAALLIGCLVREVSHVVQRLRDLLGSSCMDRMVAILYEFLDVINLTVFSDTAINENVHGIIQVLQSCLN